MGFKFTSFATPLYCWAEPGHIYIEELDGKVTDYESTIKVPIPRQCNEFNSTTAFWALTYEDSIFVGNKYGTYSQVRRSDGVLLSYGNWKLPKSRLPIRVGTYNGFVCFLDPRDNKTIYVPDKDAVFVARSPIVEPNFLNCVMAYEAGHEDLNIFSEGRFLNVSTDGTWVSPPTREMPHPQIKLQF